MRELGAAGLGLVVLCVACGETEPIGPDPDTTTSSGNSMGAAGPGGGFESGERLKARTLVGTDGSRSHAGWYDSELGTDCSFADVGGTMRCVPTNVSTFYFADEACSVPLFEDTGCKVPSFVSVNNGCGNIRVFRIGNTITPPEVVYGAYPTGCGGVQADSLGTLYATGEEVVAGDMVSASEEVED